MKICESICRRIPAFAVLARDEHHRTRRILDRFHCGLSVDTVSTNDEILVWASVGN